MKKMNIQNVLEKDILIIMPPKKEKKREIAYYKSCERDTIDCLQRLVEQREIIRKGLNKATIKPYDKETYDKIEESKRRIGVIIYDLVNVLRCRMYTLEEFGEKGIKYLPSQK